MHVYIYICVCVCVCVYVSRSGVSRPVGGWRCYKLVSDLVCSRQGVLVPLPGNGVCREHYKLVSELVCSRQGVLVVLLDSGVFQECYKLVLESSFQQ
jgi:hypothetical protein